MDPAFWIESTRDIEAIELIPFTERIQERNTFEVIENGASLNPDATAISFIPNGEAINQPIEIPYKALIYKIRQCANLFHDLGIGPDDVVSYLLPNLPQTHFILWGAETAGIVNPINPLQDAATIRDICRAAKTRILVALGDLPGTQIWQKVMAIRKEIPTLTHVIRVMGNPLPVKGFWILKKPWPHTPETG
jgi:fatty-acyl-CoA synthase